MLPMSLWESNESSGQISIHELFDNPNYEFGGNLSSLTVENLIFAACRGGWPASLKARTPKAKLMIAQNYVNSVCSEDISRIDDKQRMEKLTRRILYAYARNISTLAKSSSLLKDVTGEESIECKLGSSEIEKGAEHLLEIRRLFVEKTKPKTRCLFESPICS